MPERLQISFFPSRSPSSSKAFLARLTLFCRVAMGSLLSESGHSRSMSSRALTPRSRFRIRYAVKIHSRRALPVRLTALGPAIPGPKMVNFPNMVISTDSRTSTPLPELILL